MNKTISIVLLAVGIVFLAYGVNASNSFGSDISRFFTGSPTDKTVWFMVGGLIATIVGVLGLLRSSKE